MRFSVAWLAELLGTRLDAADLAERLTAAGLEVASVEPAAADLDGIVVARIEACRPHPGADRLSLCDVDDGTGESVQVVCGAPNARAGLLAPLARVGARLPGGRLIEQASLRGETSSGMLCSPSELALSEDASGLMELAEAAAPGTPLSEYLQLDDHIIEIDLTPNRADCLSMVGLCREVAALYRLPAKPPRPQPVAQAIATEVAASVADPADCPRYALRVVCGVDNKAATPVWMQERLRRAGLRSRSPIVDVTNYVLLEWGQPLHAFDLDRLPAEGRQLRVRRANRGERLELLNGERVALDDTCLLITAGDRPEALAGVMGGASSAVTADTVNVVLESAWFAPRTIIGKTREFGISSEAAHRFERGIDPQIQVPALERATALLQIIAGGECGPITLAEAAEHVPQPAIIRLRRARVRQLLGAELDEAIIVDLLQRLSMQVTELDDRSGWQVRAPSARLDLALEVDLIEEIARLYGYNELPSAPPGGTLQLAEYPEARIPESRIHARCVDLGYQQVMNYSFTSRELLALCYPDRTALGIANPLSSEQTHMRTGLLPGLLSNLQHNLQHKRGRCGNSVRLFETGTVFVADGEAGAYRERQHLALLACGDACPEQWGMTARAMDFYDFKGDVEHLLALNRRPVTFRIYSGGGNLHPGQAAEITFYEGGEEVRAGSAGRLHPAICQQLELPRNLFVAELQLAAVQQSLLPEAGIIARYPSIRRDLALIMPESMPAAGLVEAVRELAGPLLKRVIVFDLYQGAGIESGYKSIAIGLILQDDCGTMTDAEADSVINTVTRGLHRDLAIRRRE